MAQTQVPPKKRRVKARYIVLLCAALAIAGVLLWFFSAHGQAHYLLIGKDNWGPVGEGRSDVMMLCTLDMDGRRVSVTSLARDLKIELPGKNKREDKLNTVTHYQDEAALVSVVEELLGLPIEGYVSVNFSSVVEIIDALGGVTVNLTSQEASYLKRVEGEYYQHPLHEGDCFLNGAQALAYMRCRQLDSDFGRTDRQAKVLSALLNGAKEIDLSLALDVANTLSNVYVTNLTPVQVADAVRSVLHLRGGEFRKFTIPAEGTFKYGEVRGSSVLVANMEKNRELLYEFLGIPDPAQSAPPEGVTEKPETDEEGRS